MLICAAGDIHGALDRMYEDVACFEEALGVRFAWVLHVGDFGIWPDANRIDKATKKHDGAGDFPAWFAARHATPRRTLFIKGNHEDFIWLDSQRDGEVLKSHNTDQNHAIGRPRDSRAHMLTAESMCQRFGPLRTSAKGAWFPGLTGRLLH